MRTNSFHLNILANLGGQGWRALMSLLFVPFYVHILGIEAYGLIGIYTSLQLMLALFDAGLRPTLGREMARFMGGGLDAAGIRTLLRSVELPMAGIAVLMVVIVLCAASWLATHWVHPKLLTEAAVTQAFMAMGLVAAAQFIEAAYDSCLSGLQRQVMQNAIMTAIATLRGFGSLVVLSFVPTLSAYFTWQAVVSLISLLALRVAVYRSLPPADRPVGFSWAALDQVRSYATGMLGIAVVSLLLTQSDKLILARYLPLSDVGRYSLAASLAGALAMLSSPIFNASYPRMAQLVELRDPERLAATLHQATKMMVVLVGCAAAMLVFFGESLMRLWLHNPVLAAEAAPLLALMSLGTLCNALTSVPYMLQLAHGWTSLTLRLNTAMLVVFIPGVIFAVSHFGAMGAAGCWLGLTLSGLIISSTLMFRKILRQEFLRWWSQDIILLLVVIFGIGAVLREVFPQFVNVVAELSILSGAGVLMMGAAVSIDADLRRLARKAVGAVLMRKRGIAL